MIIATLEGLTEVRETNGLVLQRFVNGEDGFQITDELKKGLERRINDFFADKKKKLTDEFYSTPLWRDFAYMVTLVDPQNKFNPKLGNYDAILGILTAFRIRTESGFEFMLYDTIGININHRRNGHLRTIIGFARDIDLYLTRKTEHSRQLALPAGLRTSDLEEAHPRYCHVSDEWISKSGVHEIDYWVHLFGFKDPTTAAPIQPYYAKKDEVVNHIANLPPKFQKMQ